MQKVALSSAAVMVLVMFLGLGTACNKKADLGSDKGKASYGIGLQIGQNMKAQGVDVDPSAVAQGMEYALSGKDAKDAPVKQEEIQKSMQVLQEQTMKKAQETADKNKGAGDAYLTTNKAKDGWKTTASGLQYFVEKEGTGKMPKATDTVKVHYTGTLTTGEKFDSSVDRGEPAEFPVNGVIKGWTEALQLMKVGGKVKLVIPAELAYGASGRPGIPPNSVLLFDVELIEVKK